VDSLNLDRHAHAVTSRGHILFKGNRQWLAMFTLGRLRAIPVSLARANSTLGTFSSVTSPSLLTTTSTTSKAPSSPGGAQPVPTSPPKRRTQGRRNPKYPAIRPSISLERPREWNPPVAPGVIPAYDEAVAYIRADAAAVQAEADAIRSSLEKGQIPTEGIEDTRKMLDTLEIMTQVNLPEVRWKAANGMGLCSIRR
jgi:large subunit ribosomal protein L35